MKKIIMISALAVSLIFCGLTESSAQIRFGVTGGATFSKLSKSCSFLWRKTCAARLSPGVSISMQPTSLQIKRTVTKFLKIAVPLISPTLFYLFCTGFIGNLQAYTDAQVFANGHVGAQTIVYYVWNYGINRSLYGVAASASFVLAIAIMLITLLQFKISDKWVYSE